MAADQLLSADPQGGLLSADPSAGQAPAAPAVPPGTAATRRDSNALGIDHDKLQTLLEKWTSGLDPTYQKPAAILAGHWLASLAEAFSSPENIAMIGAAPAAAAMDTVAAKVGAARKAVQKPADVAIDALVKRTGFDPESMDLAATRMRLQAARSRTRQAQAVAKMGQPASAEAGAPAPVAAAPAPTPAPKPTPETLGQSLLTLHKAEQKLTASEMTQAQKWLRDGVKPDEILRRIDEARQFTAKFNLPTPTTVNANKSFPKGNRGGSRIP